MTTEAPEHEFRVTGPPGTGKTYYLSKKSSEAAKKHGGQHVMITSLTRSAASEVAGRNRNIPRDNIGTLHSIAYRSIGRPDVFGGDDISAYNRDAPAHFRLSSDGTQSGTSELSEFDPTSGSASGDVLKLKADLNKSRCIPRAEWEDVVADFDEYYTDWKRSHEVIDFLDMIGQAVEQSPEPPGDIRVIYADEVQDYSELETRLLRQWAETTDGFVLVGDPDQSIYEWRGANPDVFREPPVPDDRHKILDTSYRVPKNVVDYSQRWIQQIGPRRDEVTYEAHEDNPDGGVRNIVANYQTPGGLVNDIERHIENDDSVMILTSCAYMLKPTLEVLRDRGLPFHNPYRRKNGAWNPLYSSGSSCADKLRAFFALNHAMADQDTWLAGDIAQWIEPVCAQDYLQHGSKGELTDVDDDEGDIPVNDEYVANNDFKDPFDYWNAMTASQEGNLDFYHNMMLESWQSKDAMNYAIDTVRMNGFTVLNEDPKITVGTIHSVKGGEADHVYIAPDISKTAYEDKWEKGGADMDGIIRQFYVGLTRAKKTVNLMQEATRYSVEWV